MGHSMHAKDVARSLVRIMRLPSVSCGMLGSRPFRRFLARTLSWGELSTTKPFVLLRDFGTVIQALKDSAQGFVVSALAGGKISRV